MATTMIQSAVEPQQALPAPYFGTVGTSPTRAAIIPQDKATVLANLGGAAAAFRVTAIPDHAPTYHWTRAAGSGPPQGGGLPIATTGGTTTLTAQQGNCKEIEITGVLASDAAIVVPATFGLRYTFNNKTTGAHAVTVACPGTAATTIPQGATLDAMVDNSVPPVLVAL